MIVLDKTINSMTTFKQIIGRGTRILEEYNKLFFTIMDFKKATTLFSDPDFDGEPVVIYEPDDDDDPVPPDPEGGQTMRRVTKKVTASRKLSLAAFPYELSLSVLSLSVLTAD